VITAAAATALAATSGQPLPGFLGVVGNYLAEYGYWAILLLVLVEDFGIPVPGETILIAGAVEAGTGRLNIVLVGVVGFAAAVAGDNIGYAIGRFCGRAAVARWGKYVLLTEERLGKAERFFDAQGGKIITIARFIDGLRQANGIVAGISRMRWPKFLAFNMLGAALWVGCWVSAGYFGGQHIATIYHYVTQYSLYALIVVAVALVAWVLLLIRKRRQKARADESASSGESAAGGQSAKES
jgi:membrane protein DedA with SNARE-associated domain